MKAFSDRFLLSAEGVPGLEIVNGYAFGNVTVRGVLMSLRDLPSDLQHFTVELWGEITRTMDTVLLRAEDIQRRGQAEDRFALTCSRQVQQATQDNLSQAHVDVAPTFACVENLVTRMKGQLADDERLLCAQ